MTDLYQQFMTAALHPAVRDLAWVIASPPLPASAHPFFEEQAVSDDWCAEQFLRFLPTLSSLDRDPLALHTWLASRSSQRLGRYFESLVGYWLAHAPGLTHVTPSLQVKRDKLTLGEFDFLYRDEQTASPIHLEVAVKFYLKLATAEGWSAYVGPGVQDRLDIKLKHMFQQQLALGKLAEARAALSPAFQGRALASLGMLKGYIFYPWTDTEALGSVSSPGLSVRHLQGWWLSMANVDEVVRRDDFALWKILPKREWLSPCVATDSSTLMHACDIIDGLHLHFQQSKFPQLVAGLHREEKAGLWREYTRGFLVPNDWPDM